MFKVTINGKHTEDNIRDIQSIFDIVYNVTGDHELAVKCYTEAGNMRLGDTRKVQQKDKVFIMCYSDLKVSSIDEVLGLIRTAYKSGTCVLKVIYNKSPWMLYVRYSKEVGIRYLAVYNYKNGNNGEVSITVKNNKIVQSDNSVTVPKDVISKIESMQKALQKVK